MKHNRDKRLSSTDSEVCLLVCLSAGIEEGVNSDNVASALVWN